MNKYIVSILLAVSSQAYAASFDCNKAASTVEKIICSDNSASTADETFSSEYSRIYSAATLEEKIAMKKEQLLWLKQNRNACADAKCISDAYYARMQELKKYEHSPERLTLDVDGKPTFVLKIYDPNARNSSFNRSGGSILKGKIENCETLIDLPVGTAHGNHSYGGYCTLTSTLGTELVQVCDDDMVGHFKVEIVSGFGDLTDLARFVKANCVGG